MSDSRTELGKTFKPHWVWAIAFGSAIGWGSFVLPVTWMGQGGPIGTIVGLGIGAIIMAFIGISSGNLVRVFPVTGGAFTYAYLAFGRRHAYVCGWFLILGYAAIVALNASAFGLMIKFLWPSVVGHGYLYSVEGWKIYLDDILIISSIILLFAWLNIKGAGVSGKTQFIFCMVLLGAALLITLGMVTRPEASISNLLPAVKPGVGFWSTVAIMVAISPWAFVGFDTVPQTAEEFNFSPGKATFLILGSLAVAFIHYSYMIVATGITMPWQDLVARHDVWGTGYIVEKMLGSGGLYLLAIALVMGIFTGLIGFYISASRLMFAMSRAKALPPVFGKLHKKYKTPYAGIIFVCAICLITPWFGRSVLLWVVDMSAVGVSVAFIYYSLTAYKIFKWSANSKSNSLTCEVAPVKKVIALLALFSSLGIVGLLVVPGSPAALGGPEWIALGAWIILGVIMFNVFGRDYCKTSKDELDRLMLGDHVNKLKRMSRDADEDARIRAKRVA